MNKTVFNDLNCHPTEHVFSCATCRTAIEIRLVPYPHGPKGLNYCPVCGTKERDNFTNLRTFVHE